MASSKVQIFSIHVGKIIRMSERTVRAEQEGPVKEMLGKVENQVRKWPGLLSIESLVDTAEPGRLVVMTEWESRKHLGHWLKSDLCKQVKADLDKILGENSKPEYRELMHHEDDVFLL